MGSSVLDQLGQLHIVRGRVIYTTQVPALTSNDGSASIVDTGVGNSTITWGEAFLSAPVIHATPLTATGAPLSQDYVTVEQATTTTAEFKIQRAAFSGMLTGTDIVANQASIAAQAQLSGTVDSLTGAAVGDLVFIKPSVDLEELSISAYVSATDTIEYVLQNVTAATAIDIAAITYTAYVIPAANVLPAVADPSDGDGFMFTAFGLRNN